MTSTTDGLSGVQPRARRRRGWAAAVLLVGTLLACSLQATALASPVPPPGPTASFTFTPTAPAPGAQVTFTSTSVGQDPAHTITDTYWDFGDGSPVVMGTPVQHAYASAGDYVVRLTVQDSAGGVASTVLTVRVRTPIVPAFAFTPAAPQANTAVTFTSAATGGDAALTDTWDFGDGSPTASGPVVGHAFADAGAHTVTLSVSDGAQVQTISKVVVGNRPPTAAFTFYPINPVVGQAVSLTSFSSDPDDPIAAQAWDLTGSGIFTDAVGPLASITFRTPGNQIVQLRVTDARGAVDQVVATIPVSPAPVPPAPKLKQISPLPFVNYQGTQSSRGEHLRSFIVTAPKGTQVRVSCSGGHCPRRQVTRKVTKHTQALHFTTYERFLRGGTTLTVRVTMKGRIGAYIRVRIRSGRPAVRTTACLQPGVDSPSRCPSS